MRPRIDRLREAAEALIDSGEGQDDFRRQLLDFEDVEALRNVALDFTPHDEVSIPIYERLETLCPRDAQLAAELGFILWLCGRDEQAAEQASKARAWDENNVQGLLLAAAVSRSQREKLELYRKILEIEPSNEVARENLVVVAAGPKPLGT